MLTAAGTSGVAAISGSARGQEGIHGTSRCMIRARTKRAVSSGAVSTGVGSETRCHSSLRFTINWTKHSKYYLQFPSVNCKLGRVVQGDGLKFRWFPFIGKVLHALRFPLSARMREFEPHSLQTTCFFVFCSLLSCTRCSHACLYCSLLFSGWKGCWYLLASEPPLTS